MSRKTIRPAGRAASPFAPLPGDKDRIEGLQAQVEDLKYTLSNVLQCLTQAVDISRDQRHVAVVDDARAALRTEFLDYLG